LRPWGQNAQAVDLICRSRAVGERKVVALTGIAILTHAEEIFRGFVSASSADTARARWRPGQPPQVSRCISHGVPAEQKSTPGSNGDTLDSHKGVSSRIRTSRGVEFPLKSNIGIVEEAERIASRLPPPDPLS